MTETKTTTPTIGAFNQGYRITDVWESQFNEYIVLGKSDKAPSPWVCWYWAERGPYQGRYCSTRRQALRILAQRISGVDLTTVGAAAGAAIKAMEQLEISGAEEVASLMYAELIDSFGDDLKDLEELAQRLS